MRNRIYIIALAALFFTACQADFDPIADSSVRTMCVSLDPSGILDKFLVKKDGTFTLGYHDTLPKEMQLRVTTYCYRSDGSLHSKLTTLTRQLEPFDIYISHIDTLQEYSLCCVADFVRRSLDDVLNFNWAQMLANQRSSLYMYHSVFSGTIENHVSTARWEGRASEHIGPLTFQPETYNGYFRLTNFDIMNYVYFRWSSFAIVSLWDRSCTERLFSYQETEFYPSPSLKDTLIPVFVAHCNDSIFFGIKTRIVSTNDSAFYRINFNHRPFVCTIDCKQLHATGYKWY